MQKNGSLKIALIGAKTIGKTTIVSRMQYGKFSGSSLCTIGVSFSKLKYNDIEYEIWDTAGQERFFALMPMYLRNARILLFVCDVSDAKSLNMIDLYIDMLKNLDDYRIIVIGNKTDLLTENEIENVADIIKRKCGDSVLADRIYDYIFVSAKTGANFDIFMDKLYQCAIEIRKIDPDHNQTIKLDEEKINRRLCSC